MAASEMKSLYAKDALMAKRSLITGAVGKRHVVDTQDLIQISRVQVQTQMRDNEARREPCFLF